MVTDPFAGVLSRLQASIVGESDRMGRIPVIVAAQKLSVLTGYWKNYPRHGVSFATFDDRADAVVQHGPCGDVLWMDPFSDAYRTVFGRFLKASWGTQADLTNCGYDVDHVYNRARAKLYGYRLVRMFLVRGLINQEHGRSYEKQIGTVEQGRSVKIMKLLDGMSELKVLGLSPVKNGLLTQEHYAAAHLAAKQYGIPLDSALNTLRDMYARAHPDS